VTTVAHTAADLDVHLLHGFHFLVELFKVGVVAISDTNDHN
jgi:hypothetical protein